MSEEVRASEKDSKKKDADKRSNDSMELNINKAEVQDKYREGSIASTISE